METHLPTSKFCIQLTFLSTSSPTLKIPTSASKSKATELVHTIFFFRTKDVQCHTCVCVRVHVSKYGWPREVTVCCGLRAGALGTDSLQLGLNPDLHHTTWGIPCKLLKLTKHKSLHLTKHVEGLKGGNSCDRRGECLASDRAQGVET